MCISKRINWINSKSHNENFFFWIFLQSIHKVDMKKVVKCVQDLFAYFNALETNGVEAKPKKERLKIKLTVHSLKS